MSCSAMDRVSLILDVWGLRLIWECSAIFLPWAAPKAVLSAPMPNPVPNEAPGHRYTMPGRALAPCFAPDPTCVQYMSVPAISWISPPLANWSYAAPSAIGFLNPRISRIDSCQLARFPQSPPDPNTDNRQNRAPPAGRDKVTIAVPCVRVTVRTVVQSEPDNAAVS
jgi:hypothetical protein